MQDYVMDKHMSVGLEMILLEEVSMISIRVVLIYAILNNLNVSANNIKKRCMLLLCPDA